MEPIKLGKLIENEGYRDAIHIAIEPVIAGETLKAGDYIGFNNKGKKEVIKNATKLIGIVDPFLSIDLKQGDKFYMLLFPNTITSLRHHWTHPEFEEQEVELSREESKKWLTQFATDINASYNEIIYLGKHFYKGNYIKWSVQSGSETDYGGTYAQDYWYNNREEFIKHFKNITGLDLTDVNGGFTCGC